MSWLMRRSASVKSPTSQPSCSSAVSARGRKGTMVAPRHSTMRWRYAMKRVRSTLLRGSCCGTCSATSRTSENSSPVQVQHRRCRSHV